MSIVLWFYTKVILCPFVDEQFGQYIIPRRIMYIPIIALFLSPCLGIAAGFLLTQNSMCSAIAAVLAFACTAFAALKQGKKKSPAKEEIAPPENISPDINPSAGTAELERIGKELGEAHDRARKFGNALHGSVLHIPFLNKILALTASKSEKAVFEIIEQLTNLSDELKAVLERAETLEAQINRDGSVATVANETRASAALETKSIQELIRSSRDIADATNHMRDLVESSMGMLKDIEDVSERSQLIAVNLAIEAARIGNGGLGVKVIVTEIRSLNAQIIDFSRKAAARLKENRDLGVSIAEQMDSEVKTLALKIKDGRDISERALEKLIASAKGMNDLLSSMKLSFAKSRNGIDAMLVSMQFQDIIRQQLETAGWILEEDTQSMKETTADMEFNITADRNALEIFRGKLLDRAKVQDEKDAIREVCL